MMPSPQVHTIYPAQLVPGDTIGIIAPSSPFDMEKFSQGLSVLKILGFETVFPESIYERNGYLAGTDVHRAKLLNAMFADPAIKGIICARGGYGALRILSLIDYAIIAENPKVFIGCSDISILLNIFYAKCGLVCLHGPMIESLSSASANTRQALQNVLLMPRLLSVASEKPRVIHPGSAAGVVAGGNLTTLCHLVGTPFAPDFSGQILLFEDIGESPYRIDRMLVQMKLAGCFDHIAGMVLGSFKGCGDPENVYAVFADIFADSGFPILAGLDIGHDEPNLTLPFGIPAVVDTSAGTLAYQELPFH